MKKGNKYVYRYKIAGISILIVLFFLAVFFGLRSAYNLPLCSEDDQHSYTGKLRSIDYAYGYDYSILLMDNNGEYCIPDDMPVLTDTLEEVMSAGHNYTIIAAPEKNSDGYYVLFSIEGSNGIILSKGTSFSYYISKRCSLWGTYTLICVVFLGIYLSLFPFEKLLAKKFKKPGKKQVKFCRTAAIATCVFLICAIWLCILCWRNFPLYSEKSTYNVSGECCDVWSTSKQLPRSGITYNTCIALSGGEVFEISSGTPALRQYNTSELKTILSEKSITVTAANRLDLSGSATAMGIENEDREIISVSESHSSNLTARIGIWIIYFSVFIICILWLYFYHRKEFKRK